jgi:hypothetical protein
VLAFCKEFEHIAADGSLACSSSSSKNGRHVSVGGLHNEGRTMAYMPEILAERRCVGLKMSFHGVACK